MKILAPHVNDRRPSILPFFVRPFKTSSQTPFNSALLFVRPFKTPFYSALLGDSNPSWEASYVKRTPQSTYVEFVPKKLRKFTVNFAHRFHHDELHFMINIADVPHPHALVVRHKRSDWDLSAGDLAICVCKGRSTGRQNCGMSTD